MDNSNAVTWLNGRLIHTSEAALSLTDSGLLGISVCELIRTFRHQTFRLSDHLERLASSIAAIGVSTSYTAGAIAATVDQIVGTNSRLITDDDDLGISVFVTAGANPGQTDIGNGEATVGISTFPLRFERWAGKIDNGQHLITPRTRQLPPESVDPRIKSRSRLHWHLADRQACRVAPDASAVLLDRDGCLTETSTGNLFVVRRGRLLTPGSGVFEGISRRVVLEIAQRTGLDAVQDRVRPTDVLSADEAFTTSTGYCLLPVTRFNKQTVGDGRPGPVFRQLGAAWSKLVGVDIFEQARSLAAGRMS